jgi:hypothetical protein
MFLERQEEMYTRRHSEESRLLGVMLRPPLVQKSCSKYILGTSVLAESGVSAVTVKSTPFFEINRMHSDSGEK